MRRRLAGAAGCGARRERRKACSEASQNSSKNQSSTPPMAASSPLRRGAPPPRRRRADTGDMRDRHLPNGPHSVALGIHTGHRWSLRWRGWQSPAVAPKNTVNVGVRCPHGRAEAEHACARGRPYLRQQGCWVLAKTLRGHRCSVAQVPGCPCVWTANAPIALIRWTLARKLDSVRSAKRAMDPDA